MSPLSHITTASYAIAFIFILNIRYWYFHTDFHLLILRHFHIDVISIFLIVLYWHTSFQSFININIRILITIFISSSFRFLLHVITTLSYYYFNRLVSHWLRIALFRYIAIFLHYAYNITNTITTLTHFRHWYVIDFHWYWIYLFHHCINIIITITFLSLRV